MEARETSDSAGISLEPRSNRYIPHLPTTRQAAFLFLDCQEAFYGGAGGGGKSDALLMAALQYVDVAGYNALIIRRNFSDLALPNALMDRAIVWLRGRQDARWIENRKQWIFSGGGTLTFGFLEGTRDADRYASAEFSFIGVDELTQFSERQYVDLFARLRKPGCERCDFEKDYRSHRIIHEHEQKQCITCEEFERERLGDRDRLPHLEAVHIPLRMRSASNPGNVGHDWVKRRFVTRLGAPTGDRIFIPARLDDNPHINRDEYVKSLLNLDPVTRARIHKGDWEARSMRGVLKREWLEVVDTIPPQLSLTRYWDTAYQKRKTSDYTVGVKYGISRDGVGYIIDIARTKATPHEVETFIANIAAQDSRSVRIVLQQEPGSGSALWIDSMQRKVLLGYPTYADQVKGSKFERSQPFRAAAEAGHVKLLRGAWNEAFLEECEQFSPDEREYEHDDQIDAACGAFNCQFPMQADDAVYPLAMLEAAGAKPDEVLDDGRSPVIVGIDVAGPGKAETAVTVRSGSAVIANKTWAGRDATEQQRAVVEFLEPWRGRVQCVNVDAIGMGHYLRTALRGYVIQAINFGEEPKNRGKSWAVQCANRKAEMYWRTREILDEGGIKGLDDEMISQAAQVRFFYDLQGRIAIEPQIAAAKRGISSPDRWESVVLAFGVEPYESLAKSLAFAGYGRANRQLSPIDLRDVELERERRIDTGQRYTNPGLFSHIRRGECW